jgi:hypothetical protein
MAIALAVAGLIIGGVLVGQDLISAAATRAQIAQLDKYNSAANAFATKYGGLPGDLNAVLAARFGFIARGSYEGEGDGNGLLEGNSSNTQGGSSGITPQGEPVVFWVDLSTAGMIDGSFSTSNETSWSGGNTILGNNLPAAKIGNGNYVYVFSSQGINYLSIAGMEGTYSGNAYFTNPQLTVQQAYNIDKKVDDGMPQSGNVTAEYVNFNSNCCLVAWVGVSAWQGTGLPYGPSTAATPGSITTCYDNGNVSGANQQYSMEINKGAGLNCALSFVMQTQ